MLKETRCLSFRLEICFIGMVFHFNNSYIFLFALPIDRGRNSAVSFVDIDIFIAEFKHNVE
jgi:hypothetical protein